MPKYKIYRPGEGYLIGEFSDYNMAAAAAHALDMKFFKSQKSYENAKEAGALYQVREIEDGQEAG